MPLTGPCSGGFRPEYRAAGACLRGRPRPAPERHSGDPALFRRRWLIHAGIRVTGGSDFRVVDLTVDEHVDDARARERVELQRFITFQTRLGASGSA